MVTTTLLIASFSPANPTTNSDQYNVLNIEPMKMPRSGGIRDAVNLYLRVADVDNGFISLDERPVSCELAKYVGQKIKTYHDIDVIESFCSKAAGLYTTVRDDEDGSLNFKSASTVDVYNKYQQTGYIEYLDYWACLAIGGKEFNIFDSHGNKGSSFTMCDYLVNLETEQAFNMQTTQQFSFKEASPWLYGYAVVPFYIWNEDEEAFQVLTVQDIYNRLDDKWVNDLHTVRAEQLLE